MLFDKSDRRAKAVRNSRKLESMIGLWEVGDELDPMDVPGSYRGQPYDADELTAPANTDQIGGTESD